MIEKIATVTVQITPRIANDAWLSGYNIGLQRGVAEGLRRAATFVREGVDADTALQLDETAEEVDARVWGSR